MVEIKIIKDKLAKIVQFLKELEKVKPKGTLHEYVSNPAIRRSCERLIQLIVESAADINTQAIIGSDETPPEDYYDTFIKAEGVGFISPTLAKRLAPWAGLRNRIVHEYQDIKDKLVFEKIEPTLQNFSEYVREAQHFIEKSES
ncbi:MAG: DUF86 domain-containing protein [Candidatus Omnitrophota bacterium]